MPTTLLRDRALRDIVLATSIGALGMLTAHCSTSDADSSNPTTPPRGEAGTDDAGQIAERDAGSFSEASDAGSDDAGITDASTPTLEGVHLVGRFDMSNPSAPRFGWSASALKTRFSGTGARVTLTDKGTNMFEVVVGDEISRFVTRSGTHSYTLATGLPKGTHDVVVFKQMEATGGAVTFGGFTIDDGAIVPAAYPVTRRLEIIGDSISCGYGNEGTSPCSFSRETENQYMAYGALTARVVSAELDTIAWSGRGMYRNYDGGMTDTMPQLYERTIGTESAPWNYSFSPDAIVVNLGTNDFAKGDPGRSFVTTYVSFLEKLRGHYPSAWIIAAIGPMLGGTKLTATRAYVKDVVSTRNKAGDARVSFLEFPTQQTSDGLGCDGHPSLVTHRKMSTLLVNELHDRLGW